jgi:hypothetical protein
MIWSYLLHLLLAPAYLILGTIRHELSHALAACASGVEVKEVRVFPSVVDGKFYFGRVLMNAKPCRFIKLAPYIAVAAFAVAGWWVVAWAEALWGLHGWLVAGILCWVSPGIDLAWNILKWIVWKKGDFAQPHDT